MGVPGPVKDESDRWAVRLIGGAGLGVSPHLLGPMGSQA